MFLVLVVVFVVLMLLWGLSAIGKGPAPVATNSDLIAFLAVLCLGLIVVLSGSGVFVAPERPLTSH